MSRIKINDISISRILKYIFNKCKNEIQYLVYVLFLRSKLKCAFYKLKNKHLGETCIIVCNGPSLNKIDVGRLKVNKNTKIMTMNRAYIMFDDWGVTPDFHVCINDLVLSQFKHDLEQVDALKLYKYGVIDLHNDDKNTLPIFIRNLLEDEFSLECQNFLTSGGTVTFVCLQLAYFMGFSNVHIVGMDHNFVEKGAPNKMEVREQDVDESHCHPDYFPKGIKWQLPDLWRSELAYAKARTQFESDNREILDLTVDGKCNVFRKENFDKLYPKGES